MEDAQQKSTIRRSISSPNWQQEKISNKNIQMASSSSSSATATAAAAPSSSSGILLLSSSSTSSAISKRQQHTRLPYYYPPSCDIAGHYEYGTFHSRFPTSESSTTLLSKSSSSKIHQKSMNSNDYVIMQESNSYHRYKYYNRLFNSSENFDKHRRNDESILVIPDHVIPWYFLLPKISVPIEFEHSNERKQSSIVTIFAIWNMMMGTSLLCLPWAYHQAGLLGGCLIILLMTGLCFFTASLVIKVPKLLQIQVNEFTDLCSLLLGNVAHKISQISSLSILAGGCIVYWVLMTNFLRHVISFIYQVEFLNMTVDLNISSVVCEPNINSSNYLTSMKYDEFMSDLDYIVPGILILLIGPITCLRSVNFFLKFNIIGTLSVFYLIAFAIFKSYSWDFINISFDINSDLYVKLFDWNFPIYTGVLSLALFIHNCLTTLLKTQRNPENNQRDLAIAYTLVSITYLSISMIIYISFPLSKNCIKDNFLDNFQSNDLYAFITRLFLLLQVLSLFPLLVYMFRVQVLQIFKDSNTGQISYPFIRTIIINICILTSGCLFAEFYPQIGTIIRYCGSFSGMILIFILPTMTFIKAKIVIEKPLNHYIRICLYTLIMLGIANFISQFIVHT